MTKAKWYFLVAVLALLLFDQTFKKHVSFMTNTGKDTKEITEIMKSEELRLRKISNKNVKEGRKEITNEILKKYIVIYSEIFIVLIQSP